MARPVHNKPGIYKNFRYGVPKPVWGLQMPNWFFIVIAAKASGPVYNAELIN